eukprot:g724.t1
MLCRPALFLCALLVGAASATTWKSCGDLTTAVKFDNPAAPTAFTLDLAFDLPKKQATGKFTASVSGTDDQKSEYFCLEVEYAYSTTGDDEASKILDAVEKRGAVLPPFWFGLAAGQAKAAAAGASSSSSSTMSKVASKWQNVVKKMRGRPSFGAVVDQVIRQMKKKKNKHGNKKHGSKKHGGKKKKGKTCSKDSDCKKKSYCMKDPTKKPPYYCHKVHAGDLAALAAKAAKVAKGAKGAAFPTYCNANGYCHCPPLPTSCKADKDCQTPWYPTSYCQGSGSCHTELPPTCKKDSDCDRKQLSAAGLA